MGSTESTGLEPYTIRIYSKPRRRQRRRGALKKKKERFRVHKRGGRKKRKWKGVFVLKGCLQLRRLF
ncbi:hypothetical protein MKW98_006316 [Papaver atlanticum]|uniref:Uncharacterized protein n=1 Tax=Papaver atlanticum TaxID=357466 RepID=A0AAD4XUB9_9MAGN|nr:hypothetical protein MKW98_006316 [Papaver atlanticum]